MILYLYVYIYTREPFVPFVNIIDVSKLKLRSYSDIFHVHFPTIYLNRIIQQFNTFKKLALYRAYSVSTFTLIEFSLNPNLSLPTLIRTEIDLSYIF